MSLRIEEAPELNGRFDPRSGLTDLWTGSDSAATVRLDSNRVVWLWNDYWKAPTPGFTDRVSSQFLNNCLTVQTGLDLATANLKYIYGPSNGNLFVIPGGTHYAWPEGGIVLNGDLYITSKRVASSNWMLDEGWCVHRISNALTLDPIDWQVTFLYQSGPSPCRPILSLREGGSDTLPSGNGYVYAHGIWLQNGWRLARWTKADFIAGNFGTVTWNQIFVWVADYTQAVEQANSFLAADGSVHQRDDGRWIMVEMGASYPQGKLIARISEKSGSTYYPGSPFYPIDPALQVGDRAKDLVTAYTGEITDSTGVNRSLLVDSVWGGGTVTRTTAQLERLTGTNRSFYTPPENTTKPNSSTYAGKAHPLISDSRGLICTYVDNRPAFTGQPDDLLLDLSTYWPKFIRILPPIITRLTLISNMLVTWEIQGDPDRLELRVNNGAWQELADPSAASYSGALGFGLIIVELRATGIGGQVTAIASAVSISSEVNLNGNAMRLSAS